MAKVKGKKIDGIYDVLSVFAKKDGMATRLMAIHPQEEEFPPMGTFYVRGDYVFVPKRRRGEKFKVIYTVIEEVEF